MPENSDSADPTDVEIENVRVVVRVRPMDKFEQDAFSENIIKVDKLNRSVVVRKPNASTGEPPKIYYFDNVFGEDSSQLICILCIGLIDEPATNSRIRVFVSQRTVALAYSTFASYLIISAAFLFGKLVKDHWPWKTSAVLSLIAFILYAACAATLLKDWVETKERNYWPPNTQRLDLVCATGFICVIGTIVFLIDLIVTARAGSRGHLGD